MQCFSEGNLVIPLAWELHWQYINSLKQRAILVVKLTQESFENKAQNLLYFWL